MPRRVLWRMKYPPPVELIGAIGYMTSLGEFVIDTDVMKYDEDAGEIVVLGAPVGGGGGVLSGLTVGTVPAAESATSVKDSDQVAGPVLLGSSSGQPVNVQAGDAPNAASDGGEIFLRAGEGGVNGVGGSIKLRLGSGDSNGKFVVQNSGGTEMASIDSGGGVVAVSLAIISSIDSGSLSIPGLLAVNPDAGGSVTVLSKIILAGLPTSDPNAEGQLWNDSGTLKVSSF